MRLAAALSLVVAGCAPTAPARQAPVAPRPVEASLPLPSVWVAPASLPSHFVLTGERTQGGVITGTVPAGTAALHLDNDAIPVASDGRFLIAFDRDAAPSARLVAGRADGRSAIVETLTISPRAWRIERIAQLARFSAPTAEFTRLREPELAQIAAARDRVTGAQGWRQHFIWPATGRISGLFGAQRIYRGGEAAAYHSGVDVAKGEGAPVVAPADGVVILAADHPFTLEGNLLMIDHGMGMNSAFLHLSHIAVRDGEAVKQGQLIGNVGHTGRATGRHLHWSMKWRDARLDPILIAGNMPTLTAP